MLLHFRKYGEGRPPLIILHGLLGSGGNWHTLASKVFQETHTVYVPDLRNHGRSPHVEGMSIPEQADDVIAVMDAESLGSVALLGHSMGGKVAMELALGQPGRVEQLVVADIAPRAYPPGHLELIAALRSLDLTAYSNRAEVDQALATSIPDLATRQFLLKNLATDAERRAFYWQPDLDAINRGYPDINVAITGARQYEKPTLFIRGGRSRYILDDDVAGIRELFPQAAVETISRAGHWVHAEAPSEFAALVSDFLSAPRVVRS